jgi:hypothetical protein
LTSAPVGSPAWVDDLARSLREVDAGGVTIAVLHRIEGGPAWVVAADGRSVTARPAASDDTGDTTFTWQPEDAAAVSVGTTTVLAVFGTGRLRIGGDLRRLADATALFAAVPGLVA